MSKNEWEKTSVKKPELSYITYFRGIAILFIVAGHTIIWGLNDMYRINRFAFSGGTLYFVFIAGFLFQYLSYKFRYADYLKKKFFNVILPYILTIAPFAIYYSFFYRHPNDPLISIYKPLKFILCFLCGRIINGPVWFIGMIIVFFLAAPLFVFLKKHARLWYFLLVLSLLYTIFFKRPDFKFVTLLAPKTFWDVLIPYVLTYFKTFFYFISPYMLGMTLCSLSEHHSDLLKKYKIPILSALFLTLSVMFILLVFVFPLSVSYWGCVRITTCMLIFFLLYYFEKQISKAGFTDKTLKFLAKYSFGIFFIHMWFVNIMFNHALICVDAPRVVMLNRNFLRYFLYSGFTFFFSLIGSIAVLFIIKTVLTRCNVKNTRMFTGV